MTYILYDPPSFQNQENLSNCKNIRQCINDIFYDLHSLLSSQIKVTTSVSVLFSTIKISMHYSIHVLLFSELMTRYQNILMVYAMLFVHVSIKNGNLVIQLNFQLYVTEFSNL